MLHPIQQGAKPVATGKRIATYGAAKVDTAASVNRKSRYVLEVGKGRFLDAKKPLNPVGRYINGGQILKRASDRLLPPSLRQVYRHLNDKKTRFTISERSALDKSVKKCRSECHLKEMEEEERRGLNSVLFFKMQCAGGRPRPTQLRLRRKKAFMIMGKAKNEVIQKKDTGLTEGFVLDESVKQWQCGLEEEK